MKSFLLIITSALCGILLFVNSIHPQATQEKVETQGTLALGKPQQKTLAPDVIHVWSLGLEKGQYVVVEVLQKGIDVVVRIVDPNGTRKREIDSPTGTSGTEKAAWIAQTTGVWKVEIAPLEASQPADYEINWVILHKATEIDRQTVEADSLNNLAMLYKDQDKYVEAEPLYRRSLEIREKTLGPNHLDVAASLNDLAEIYYYQVKYAEAEPLYRRSLEIREKTLGPDHPDVARSLSSLALLYLEQSKYIEAEPLYRRSLEIREKNLGPNHPDVAHSLNGLAVLYKAQGKYAEAESLYRRSLGIWEKTLGPDDSDVARSLNNLAVLYCNQGKYTEAEPLYRRSLEIREKNLGPNHPDVAESLNNLAWLYNAQGKYAEAELLYRRSLKIGEKTHGPNHPGVAVSLNNLAALYWEHGKYTDAEPLYQRSLKIWEKTLGANHPDVAHGLNNLAVLYKAQGKYAEAESLYKSSLAIWKKALGPDHPRVALSLNNLANLYKDQGKYDEAEPLYQRSLKIWEKGSNHSNVALSLNNLATLYRDKGKYAEAESLFRRSLEIRERTLGPNHPDVAQSLNNLAGLCWKQSKYAEAESLIERAIRFWDTTTGYPDRRTIAYALRARLRKQKGDLEGALADLTEALRLAEALRPQIGGGDETRAGFYEQHSEYFNLMVAWQLETGQIEKALEYAERGRARVLLDQLATSQIDLRNSIPTDIRVPLEKRETDAKARLAKYRQRITLLRSRKDLSNEEKQRQIAVLEDSLRLADRDYQQVYEEVKNASPLWRDLITSSGQAVPLAEIQSRLISENGLMLLYQIGKEGSYLFVIPAAGQKPEVMSLQIPEDVAAALQVEAGPLKSTALQKILIGQDTTESNDETLVKSHQKNLELPSK